MKRFTLAALAGSVMFVAGCVGGVSTESAPPDDTGGKQSAVSDDTLSLKEIMVHALNAGVPCDRLVVAGALALGESDGYRYATHANGATGDCPYGSTDKGIWQINDCYWPQFDEACVFDPACNAQAMSVISNKGASFHLWSAYTNGRYELFLSEAQAAYDAGVPGCTAGGGDPGGGSGATCDELGYEGQCFGDVSLWAENGACMVRDCGGEGKSCGLISAEIGYGCVEGTQGSTAFQCGDVGYEGACLSDTLVWAEDGQCRAVHCPDSGKTCGWEGGGIGYNCM